MRLRLPSADLLCMLCPATQRAWLGNFLWNRVRNHFWRSAKRSKPSKRQPPGCRDTHEMRNTSQVAAPSEFLCLPTTPLDGGLPHHVLLLGAAQRWTVGVEVDGIRSRRGESVRNRGQNDAAKGVDTLGIFEAASGTTATNTNGVCSAKKAVGIRSSRQFSQRVRSFISGSPSTASQPCSLHEPPASSGSRKASAASTFHIGSVADEVFQHVSTPCDC